MVTTISNIGTEISSIISKNNIIDKITEQERIDNFLDTINRIKSKLLVRIEKNKKLDSLFSQITWLNIESNEDEILLKKVIEKAKKYHNNSLKDYAYLNSMLTKKNICKKEISDYKVSLDDFEDTVIEVEQIFFSLRNDQEFNDLLNSI